MQVNNALNTGVQGFQNAQARANQAAQEIATQQSGNLNQTDSSKESSNNKDLTNSLVDLKTAENDAKANARVIESASDILGTILDISV